MAPVLGSPGLVLVPLLGSITVGSSPRKVWLRHESGGRSLLPYRRSEGLPCHGHSGLITLHLEWSCQVRNVTVPLISPVINFRKP